MLRQKIVYLIVAIMLVLLMLQNNISPARLQYLQEIGYGAEDMIVSLISNAFFTYFLAAIISFIACRDFEQNILKNVYAKGFTGEKVYTAKFLFILLITSIVFVLTILIGCIQTAIVFGLPPMAELYPILFAQFIAVLAYAAFDVLFCVIFKKSGLALAFLILVPPLGGLLLDLADMYLHLPFSLGNLWITQAMAYIHGGSITTQDLLYSLLTSACYMIGCFFLGRFIAKHQR